MNIANEVKKILPATSSLPKFGYSSTPCQEKNCESVLVLMQCLGQITEKRCRVRLSPDVTLRQAREECFGKDLEQKLVLDENNFIIREQDLDTRQ